MRNCLAWYKLLACLVLFAGAHAARAEVLNARIEKITTGAGTLQGVQARLDWPRGTSTGQLRLRAARLDFPSLKFKAEAIEWTCPVLRDAHDGRWRCAGPIRSKGNAAQQLALQFTTDAITATLGAGKQQIRYTSDNATPGVSRVQVGAVPVSWLKPFLADLWPAGRWNGGTLAGSVEVSSPRSGPFEVHGDLALADVDLETPDGLLAAADLDGRLQVQFREQGSTQRVEVTLAARSGELLFDRLYTKFSGTPVQIQVLAQRSKAGAWRLPKLSWRDPGVLLASGQATLASDASIDTLDLDLDVASLVKARDRYLSGFLGPAGFSDLVLSGRMRSRVQLSAGVPSTLHAHFDEVNAIDAKGRFTFAGIDGDLRWNASDTVLNSAIGWQSGAMFGIGLGPADFRLASSRGELRLGQPVSIAALKGKIVLESLRWQAPQKTLGPKFQFGLRVQSLDLASLSQRLGWPAFTGTVDGRIPSARYEASVLTLDGGLQMNLFDGSVELTGLSMERPFGVAPTLSADVAIENLDLEPMTKVFDFGSITGRLDGQVKQLRLVDWSPVAFDARLQTDTAAKGKRRISQRAVKNISNVGGSGVAGGLQAQALKFFDDFGYQQIGLRCILKDNVCTMDGISSAGDGYIIVAGAGLPRIQVVGFRRKVDWPTLVSRLQAATEGQAPVIN